MNPDPRITSIEHNEKANSATILFEKANAAKTALMVGPMTSSNLLAELISDS